jgi:hypothetical protein
MKKQFLTLLILIPFCTSAQINSFPYFENFESGSGGWTSSTLVGGDSWNLGTPDGTVINTAAPGGSVSWYVDTLDTGINEQSHVISPVFDFTNVAHPMLEIDIWWNLVFDSDGAVFQSSTDGGSSWQNVGSHLDDPAFAPNWFNHAFLSMGFPNGGAGSQSISHWTGDGPLGSQGWVTAKHILTGLGGESSVQLRMAWINKTNNLGNPTNGIAFDNIQITDAPAVDLSVDDLAQAGPCGGGYPGVAVLTVTNYGAGSATFDLTQDSLGNNFPIDQTTVPGFGTVQIPIQLPLQNPGDTMVNVGVVHPDDANPSNNFVAGNFNCNVNDGANYCDDFEDSTAVQWHVDVSSQNSSWNLGANSTNQTINTPSSGSNFWGTTGLLGTYNSDEQSYLISPFFDFTDRENIQVSFELWHDLETDYDGAVFQSSTDGGLFWQNVGSMGSGTNWFNAGPLNGGGAGGQNVENWNGSSSTWVTSTQTASNLDGQPAVLFRFALGADDIAQDGGVGIDDFCVSGDVIVEPIDTPNLVINEFALISEDSSAIEIYNKETVEIPLDGIGLSGADGMAGGPFILLTGSIPPLGYHVVGFSSNIPLATLSWTLSYGDVQLDAVCVGDFQTLEAIGVECDEGNVEFYSADASPLPGCSLSRIPNGADSDSNGSDFQIVANTVGAENLVQSCSFTDVADLESVEIGLYPNPASRLISVESSTDLQTIQIIDSSGREVMIESGSRGQMDVSNLVPGIYNFIAADSEGRIGTRRFVKQ